MALSFLKAQLLSCYDYNLDEDSVYDSNQSLLQTVMTVATLLMGIIITGALISVAYDKDVLYTQRIASEFTMKAFRAFGLSFIAMILPLAISVTATQMHSHPCAKRYVIRFLAFSSVFVYVSEMCMFESGVITFQFIEDYIRLAYIAPSEKLCPSPKKYHRNNPEMIDMFQGVPKANTFCGLHGADLYDTALELCGPPRPTQIRAFDPNDFENNVCSQLDWYEKAFGAKPENVKTAWFGWDITQALDDLAPNTSIADEYIIMNNAKIIGEKMCHKGIAEQFRETACKNASQGVACNNAIRTSIKADDCAGGKYDDTMTCFRSCARANMRDDLGDVVEPKVRTTAADTYRPVAHILWVLETITNVCMLVRTIVFFGLVISSWCAWLVRNYDFEDDEGYGELEASPPAGTKVEMRAV